MTRFSHAGSLACLVALALAAQPALGDEAEYFNEPAPIDAAASLDSITALENYLQDADVAAAQYLQPPALATPAAPAAESPRTYRRSARSEYVRLARVPNMLGDSLGTGGQLNVTTLNGQFSGDLPLGIGRSNKVGENNKALPMDRVYFIYNGFQNALTARQFTPPGPPQTIDSNVDRYTVGGEKTFFDGLASLDVRMPFTGAHQAGGPPFPVGVASQNVGDLSLFFKGLLYADDNFSLVAGVGVSLPTAGDVRVQILAQQMRIRNEAVHVLPYLGFLSYPTENWFVQGFIQGDCTASGFPVELTGFPNTPVLTEQSLMYYDLLVGRWLYVNECAHYLRGIAGLFELHYTTSVQQADFVPFGGQFFGGNLGNQANWVDYLNLTAGLHFQIGPLANLRVAAVVPLKQDAANRQFDSEVLVSFNRFF